MDHKGSIGGGYLMSRTRKAVLTAMMLVLPVTAASCKIPLGVGGCNLLVLEPGTQFGVSCNPF